MRQSANLQCIVPLETLAANERANRGKREAVRPAFQQHGRKLAIVGGGPSVVDYLAELRSFDGDVWAINRAGAWLRSEGVSVTATILCDPVPEVVEMVAEPVGLHYVATCCDPGVLDALAGVPALLFDMTLGPKGQPHEVHGGPTCITRAPNLAAMLGYRDISLYGADSSFTARTHAYAENPVQGKRMRVKVGSEAFETTPGLLAQAEWLADYCAHTARTLDPIVRPRFGGLAAAMVAAGGFDGVEAPMGKHVFLATPCHNGHVHVAYVQSFMQTVSLLAQNGIAFTHSFIVGNSLVHDARNRLVTSFLEHPEATDMLFLDADIGWEPEAALRLILSPHDVIGGAYPQKREWPGGPLFNVGIKHDAVQTTSLLEVDFLGTGFLKISKKACQKLVKDHPEWAYGDGRGGKVYALFNTSMENGKIEGEDVVFCRRWQAAGGKVFLDPDMTLVHIGEKAFRGCFADLLDEAMKKAAA